MSRASIALVTLDYPPEQGGVARYLGNLVHASNGAIDVFVPETHQASGPGHVRQAHFFSRGWPAWRPMIGFIRSLSRRGFSYALISHALPIGTADWLSRLMGGPKYAVLFHGLDLRLALRSKKTRWVLHRVLRGASLVIANSQFVAQEIRQFDATIKPTVITPAVESLEFSDRNTARQNCDVSDQSFIILAVARLVMRKGIDHLIEAMSELPSHVKLVIIGDGPEAASLQLTAQSLQLSARVMFIPRATDYERNAWYAAADIFALP
ncbi:MAG: glycosyltransferase family 4 protein, partial [Candidatus Uhrbacteria bacterium]|nr:glycosyltransferase family 4 protein [Candidatus Uhrbacteria bacterium]